MSNPKGQPASDSQKGSSSQQQQAQRVRKPPFADWPTLKILTPPQGQHSTKSDEWCFTYCSQSVTGRIQGRESNCRSMCIRKVFPHEVRNIINFKKHAQVDADGKASYPLPAEGQPVNLPPIFGGQPPEDDEDGYSATSSKGKGATRNWDEGWYVWTSTSRKAAMERMALMSLDLKNQQQYRNVQEQRKEVWQDYQDQLNQGSVDKEELAQRHGGKFSNAISPPTLTSEERAKSMLLQMPPEWPSMWTRIGKLLAPSQRAVSILRESLVSGEQKDFAVRVFEKARTDEPFILAQRTFSHAYERWKDKDTADEDDSKKGST